MNIHVERILNLRAGIYSDWNMLEQGWNYSCKNHKTASTIQTIFYNKICIQKGFIVEIWTFSLGIFFSLCCHIWGGNWWSLYGFILPDVSVKQSAKAQFKILLLVKLLLFSHNWTMLLLHTKAWSSGSDQGLTISCALATTISLTGARKEPLLSSEQNNNRALKNVQVLKWCDSDGVYLSLNTELRLLLLLYFASVFCTLHSVYITLYICLVILILNKIANIADNFTFIVP